MLVAQSGGTVSSLRGYALRQLLPPESSTISLCFGYIKPGASQVGKECEIPQNFSPSFLMLAPVLLRLPQILITLLVCFLTALADERGNTDVSRSSGSGG